MGKDRKIKKESKEILGIKDYKKLKDAFDGFINRLDTAEEE